MGGQCLSHAPSPVAILGQRTWGRWHRASWRLLQLIQFGSRVFPKVHRLQFGGGGEESGDAGNLCEGSVHCRIEPVYLLMVEKAVNSGLEVPVSGTSDLKGASNAASSCRQHVPSMQAPQLSTGSCCLKLSSALSAEMDGDTPSLQHAHTNTRSVSCTTEHKRTPVPRRDSPGQMRSHGVHQLAMLAVSSTHYKITHCWRE